MDWWHVAAARNTHVLAAKGDYLVFLDDRSVLEPGWLQAIRRAAGQPLGPHPKTAPYAVAGLYEKRTGMNVSHGVIALPGTVTGRDHRRGQGKNVRAIAGGWFFGGTLGMPLEWALQINGFDERMDSVSMEDCMCGLQLQNNGLDVRLDPQLAIVQDRSDGHDHGMRRSSKERHPHDKDDKAHVALRTFALQKRANHPYDLRRARAAYQATGVMPHHENAVTTDWFDGQPLAEMR